MCHFGKRSGKIQNILETIEGMNGIKILKPTGNDGYGWRITKDADGTELPEGSSSDVALKWDNVALKWVAVLPVDTTNDEQSDTLEDGDRVVTGIKTGGSGKLIQLITKPLGEVRRRYSRRIRRGNAKHHHRRGDCDAEGTGRNIEQGKCRGFFVER